MMSDTAAPSLFNTRRSWTLLSAFLLSLLLCHEAVVLADATSPWVTSEHVADTSSMEAFAEHAEWKNLAGQPRALAIWKYLTDNETGVYHFNPAREGPDRRDMQLHVVRDPVKMLNSYGYGFCGAFGPTTAGIFEGAGFEKARAIGIPGSNHCVTEVWYDNDWHYFDVDLRGVLFESDGKTVASIQDIVDQPDLFTKPSRKVLPFFTNDPDLSIYARGYTEKPVDHFYAWSSGGTTMDYRLRRGETFTRWWQPRDGRWAHQDEDVRGDFWRKLLEREPYGAKSNHANFSVWTHGNGLFDYQPVLKKGCGDFEDGVFFQSNVVLTDNGVTVAKGGGGEVVFEVNSPYVIVPKVGKLEDRSDDSEASIVQFTSHGNVRTSLSLDFGRTWTNVEPTTAGLLDLTPSLRERYQYLLKFTLTGEPKEVVLKSLRMQTWVQVAPASLPRLKQGVNRLRYQNGDKHGLATTPWMQSPFLGDREKIGQYWKGEPRDFDPNRFQSRVKGEMELVFPAPPGRRIEWMSVGGFFAAHRREHANKTANEIWYATDDADDWQQVYKSEVPDWNDHWHYGWDGDMRFSEPVRQVRVRYVGNPGVNAVRVNLHSSRSEPSATSPVSVTHGYELDGKLVEKHFEFSGANDYSIECPGTPKNIFIAFQVPSDSDDDRPKHAHNSRSRIRKNSEQPAARPAVPNPERHDDTTPAWVPAMKNVHAKFTGQPGFFAQYGDSITNSRAFWFSLKYKRDNAPPEMVKAFEMVSKHMIDACWDFKGPDNGNQGGRTIRWGEANLDGWLKRQNPEVAIVMFGTNDLNSVPHAEYAELTRKFVKRCLDNGTVVILSTIPPRHRFENKAAEYAEVVRAIAAEFDLPLIDFHAEILKRRPDDWNGALDKFNDYQGYDVPTLIARDGVHPSAPKPFRGDFSEESLRKNGFALRNFLTLMKYAEVIERVLSNEVRAADSPAKPTTPARPLPPKQSWFPQAPPLAPPVGQVVRVSSVDELFDAAKSVRPGGTIMVADGHYMMPRYFAITTDDVTLRSESGDRHAVIIDGANSRHGELVGITGCKRVTIADLTIQNIKWNGFKINSNLGTDQVTIRNCVIHNIWQRGIKAPAMPKEQGDLGPRDCRIQYCLFYNDRPKRFSDDETETPDRFNGNYIGGIDVKNTINWTISDNVFIGIHGRTHEGRAGIYISENGRGCTIERNIFLDCDVAIALGNPTLGYSPLQAINCVARNNFISSCPETGILACYTRDCRIENNTIHDPDSRLKRPIWVQNTNEALSVTDNLLLGPPVLVTSRSMIEQSGNVVHAAANRGLLQQQSTVGQTFLDPANIPVAIKLPATLQLGKE